MSISKIALAISVICLFMPRYVQARTDSSGNKAIHYAPSVISVIPFQFTENGIGLGVSYERVIDKRGLFAFIIPAVVTFDVANSNRIYDYNTGNYNTGKADPMFYTMPGIKFYPTGCYGKIKYATGVSLVIATGRQSTYFPDLSGLNLTERVSPHFLSGLMWQNSLNVNMDAHLYVGAEVGIGGTFINRLNGAHENNEVLVQGALKIGYRF